jgi:hypothetical protein
MSGPYSIKPCSETAWTVVGPTETGWAHWSEHTTQQHADSLNAAYAAGQAGGEWQDIETAPKDGVQFLVYCPEIGCTFAVYRRPESPAFLTFVASYDLAHRFSVTPTHWMPLPKHPLLPPQTSTRDGG